MENISFCAYFKLFLKPATSAFIDADFLDNSRLLNINLRALLMICNAK